MLSSSSAANQTPLTSEDIPQIDGLTILCQIVGVLESKALQNWAYTIEIWQGYIGRGKFD